MTKLERIIFLILVLSIPVIIIFWDHLHPLFANTSGTSSAILNQPEQEKQKESKEEKSSKETQKGEVRIVERWEMPAQLTEISGIAYMSKNRFASVQDEVGKIFIYNTANSRIDREIPFAPNGDYEDVAIVGEAAYIIRADGKLFEVVNLNSNEPEIKQYTTPLTAKHDVEGLCYDKKNNRLLLAIKGEEKGNKDFKGIYAFDLGTKKLTEAPAFKIDLTHSLLKEENKKKGKKMIQPSAITVHPVSGDLYVLDGPDAKLLIMDKEGKTKKLYQLSNSLFPQPEGIAFNDDGDLFISNEAKEKEGKGTILKVSIEEEKANL